jgi:tricarboxylate carrier
MSISQKAINIDEPRYDQSTYIGRAKHFFVTTNPLNILASNRELEEAKNIVESYRKTKQLPSDVSEDKLWKSKYLMDSAYHPDTKEKMFFIGRMSAQVPCNLIITAGMLTWYKTTAGTVFWQVINQSFNAVVNYTNRSGDKPISKARLGISFGIATTSATATALFLNSLTRKMPPLVGRFVPFAAVAAANCVNLPFMRSSEIQHGIQLVDKNGEKVGQSPKAAKKAIAQVVMSRVFMATPGIFFYHNNFIKIRFF